MSMFPVPSRFESGVMTSHSSISGNETLKPFAPTPVLAKDIRKMVFGVWSFCSTSRGESVERSRWLFLRLILVSNATRSSRAHHLSLSFFFAGRCEGISPVSNFIRLNHVRIPADRRFEFLLSSSQRETYCWRQANLKDTFSINIFFMICSIEMRTIKTWHLKLICKMSINYSSINFHLRATESSLSQQDCLRSDSFV